MPGQQVIVQERAHVRTPRLIRYLVTGQYILSPGDNASFLHDATEDYRRKPVARYSRARWRRVARRNAALTVPTLLAVSGPWAGWWPLFGYLAALVLTVPVWAAWRAARWLRARRLHREWTFPAAAVACSVLNIRYSRRRALAMLEIPTDWGSGAEHEAERQAVRLHVPAGTALSTGIKAQLVGNVGARLGIPNPIGDWREAGTAVSVDIKGAPVPPARVTLAEIRKAINEADETETVVGRASSGHVVKLSTAEDSPHFLMSGPSGTGKSVLIKLFLGQRLHRGDGVVMLDPKRWSHWRWAGGGKIGRDRLVYAYRTEDIHAAWLAVAEEAERRIELDEDELAEVRRVWICVEEINTQTKRLARYWKAERKRISNAAKLAAAEDMDFDEADLDPPAQSPAIAAMQESVGMGRELKMHVVVAAQRASAAVFGGNGGDTRESFQGGRMIARWDRKLWRMLVDTIAYVACPVGPRGIWGLARGEDFTVFRVPMTTDAEATEMATSGAPATGPVLGPQGVGKVVDSVATDRLAIERGQPLSAILAQLPGQDGPRALSLDGLRTAAKRPGFPSPVGQEGRAYLYDVATVIDWRAAALSEPVAS